MNNDIQSRVGNRIRELREEKGYTQAELADITNLSNNYIGYLERGKKGATLETLERIASALGAKIENLLNFPKSQPQKPQKLIKKEQLIIKLCNYLKMCDLRDINLVFDIAKRFSKK